MDLIHVIVHTLVHGLDPTRYKHLALQLPGLVDAGKALKFFDQLHGFFIGNEFRRLYAIHQQFQLRQLESAVRHVIASTFPPYKLHIYPKLAQLLHIVVQAFPFCIDPMLCQ